MVSELLSKKQSSKDLKTRVLMNSPDAEGLLFLKTKDYEELSAEDSTDLKL